MARLSKADKEKIQGILHPFSARILSRFTQNGQADLAVHSIKFAIRNQVPLAGNEGGIVNNAISPNPFVWANDILDEMVLAHLHVESVTLGARGIDDCPAGETKQWICRAHHICTWECAPA